MRAPKSLLLGVAAALVAMTSSAHAQTWSLKRRRPSLFEIIAVDRTSESQWPFGQEDIAGDGVSKTDADEAAVDLRSVYADARAKKLWMRAYVAATVTPTPDSLAFFFIDSDADPDTGGSASDSQIFAAFKDDKVSSPSGYERAVEIRGDGTVVALFAWDTNKMQWAEQSDAMKMMVTGESGVARDPLRLAGDDHGYVQVELDLTVAALDDACDGTIFVRTWRDGDNKRKFGDLADAGSADCHAHLNRFGDPDLLHSDNCTSDDTCPARGRCSQGTCLFGYECSDDGACQTGQRCQSGVCVRVLDRDCTYSADCDSLVCDDKRCVACTSSGATACEASLVCSPNGSCLRAPKPDNPLTDGESAAVSGERVRGGAFACTAAERGARGGGGALVLLLALAALLRLGVKR
jgi:hypothetical protein